MGDAPDKPDPQGFLYLASKLSENSLGDKNVPIAYVGDTIADINTVSNAKKIIPSQKFISIAVAPPHLHSEFRMNCLLYTSPSPRDRQKTRMPSSA